MSTHVEQSLHVDAATRGAVGALRDRVLTMATNPSPALVDEIDPNTGGLVVAGRQAPAMARRLRLAHPDLPLLIEPDSVSNYVATAEASLQVASDGLFDLPLDVVLQGQRDAGASLVVVPSGQIPAQDAAALRAVIDRANEVSDSDVVTPVVVQDTWLTPDWVGILCATLNTSAHPVAIGVVNGSADPLERKGAVAGYRRVAQEAQSAIAWRADLSGIGALANGAIAAVIGRRPSQRRYSAAGSAGHASRPGDKTPHVLLPAHLRYSRAQWMHIDLFAQGDPLTCPCQHCGGLPVDRFDDSAESAELADLHNALALREIIAACVATPAQERSAWWSKRLRDAQEAHVALGVRVGRPVETPKYIDRWLGEAD